MPPRGIAQQGAERSHGCTDRSRSRYQRVDLFSFRAKYHTPSGNVCRADLSVSLKKSGCTWVSRRTPQRQKLSSSDANASIAGRRMTRNRNISWCSVKRRH
jgi:hypothetical protein